MADGNEARDCKKCYVATHLEHSEPSLSSRSMVTRPVCLHTSVVKNPCDKMPLWWGSEDQTLRGRFEQKAPEATPASNLRDSRAQDDGQARKGDVQNPASPRLLPQKPRPLAASHWSAPCLNGGHSSNYLKAWRLPHKDSKPAGFSSPAPSPHPTPPSFFWWKDNTDQTSGCKMNSYKARGSAFLSAPDNWYRESCHSPCLFVNNIFLSIDWTEPSFSVLTLINPGQLVRLLNASPPVSISRHHQPALRCFGVTPGGCVEYHKEVF